MIQLEYVAHSCFLVTCGETKLLFDPWLKGAAYQKQWHLWPLPVLNPKEIQADAILISHGHEDHLNATTLKLLGKQAHVFFPFQWREGIKPYLQQLGYTEVTEAVNFKTYICKDIEITYVSFSLESVIIIKYKDEVLVNINDALNSNHENAANFMLKKIKERWPKIDYLLSGWSGASYFPNQIRYPGKDDKEVGKLREQYFANNFCKFTHYLQPTYAIPIAPGFVLLKEENQWINDVKFSRKNIHTYYKEHFSGPTETKMLVMYPGDKVKEGNMHIVSILHDIPEQDHTALAYRYYAKEKEETNTLRLCSEEQIDELLNLLKYWITHNKQLYHLRVIEDVAFSICLEDVEQDPCINISFEKNVFHIERSTTAFTKKKLQINTSAERLISGFKKVWGGDIITVGYGLTVEVSDELTLEKNLDIVCVRLITRYPITREDLLKQPFRAFRFYTSSPESTTLWIRQKIMLKPYVNKYPFNERDHWITYNKCSLCAVCKMPEVDLEAYA